MFFLSGGSIKNSLSTSQVRDKVCYTLIFLRPHLWDETGYVVAVVVVVDVRNEAITMNYEGS